ncbi:MAG: patatin-like phospholipase family protein [Prolixibacteraceae bacterium]|nr:patatin-like phospholipase family protein [Prolixibacteraceae bacterium]MBN2775852.1 patatin-like phospholipase family protein [Prolixibacteraceae bacterium]
MEKYNRGFVLSGGGARGFAHLGILQYLKEKGIYPDIISGVSAGAIVGAFIASGKEPFETLEILAKGGFLKYTKIHLPVDGLLKLDGLKELFIKEIEQQNIEELKIPLIVGATNLNLGKVDFFDQGPIHEIVLASSSIPVLFSPVNYNGFQYVDGGVLNNLPVEPLLGKCYKIITQNINPINETGKIKNLIQVATRTFHLGVHARIDFAKKNSDLYIEPKELDKFDLLKANKADKVFEVGYKFAEAIDLKDFI